MNRNQPCGCGSGRRFKHCCGQPADTPTDLSQGGDPLASARQALKRGQFATAIDLLRAAFPDQPDHPQRDELLGFALLQAGHHEAAAAELERVVAQRPNQPGGWFNLGLACQNCGERARAEAAYLRVLELVPGNPPASINLAALWRAAARLTDAADILATALEHNPDDTRLQLELGTMLNAAGREDQAEAPLRRVVDAAPHHHQALVQLGLCLFRTQRSAEALECFARAADADPGDAQALVYQGAALHRSGQYMQAQESLNRALARAPRHAPALAALARLEKDLGLAAEARTHYGQALDLDPDNRAIHSNLLMTLNYLDDVDEQEVARAHRQSGRRIEVQSPRRAGNPGAAARLRLGFVSPDLREHSVAYFLRPLLRELDRDRYEMTAFSCSAVTDEVTHELRALVDHWVPIHELDDPQAARVVADAGIDVLIDLAGHSAGNRLGLFALRPAPVQATWLGYPNMTGLRSMDYRLTDLATDPTDQPGESEALLRLQPRFSCYGPPTQAPEVAPAPSEKTGTITLGSFNNLAKLSPAVVACWAAILDALPTATLCLKSRALCDPAVVDLVQERFARHGVAPQQLRILGRDADKTAHLGRYAELDLALDPFPYNGTTTTCEALWMGVPVLALRGLAHRSRVSAGILDSIGLPELVADSRADYVARAVAMAANPVRLAELRAGMRQRMTASALMDAAGFARAFEAALQQMVPDHQ